MTIGNDDKLPTPLPHPKRNKLEDFDWSEAELPTPKKDIEELFTPVNNDTITSSTPTESDDSFLTSQFMPQLPSTNASITRHAGNSLDNLHIDMLLKKMLELGGSDLHLSARAHPTIRVHGDMSPLTEFPRLSGEQIQTLINDIMTSDQHNRFDKEWELDFAYTLPGYSRFRVNVMKQKKEVSVVMRAIPWKIKTVEELGLPEIITSWANLPRGLVLITGPTGSGKSTTLAAIIDFANRTRAAHIVTIEEPIEFVHDHQKSVINQREVGEDTHSFSDALKHVLRQDPDIILIGEMRDLETISVALTAAETGHLVFGTLHTQSAEDTINRIIDAFPDAAKSQVRTQLASTLQGVACQTLLKKKNGGRTAAVEIMTGTSAIKNLIRENKVQQIQGTIQASKTSAGMQTLDSQLNDLVVKGIVDWKEAAGKSTNYQLFVDNLGGEKALIDAARKEEIQNQQRNGGFLIP